MAVPALDGPLLCRVGFKGGKMAMSMARKADIFKEKKAQMESMISLLEAAYGCDRKEMKAAFQKYALLEEPLEDAMRKNREQFVRLSRLPLSTLRIMNGNCARCWKKG